MANKAAPRAARANKEELLRQGRISYNQTRGLDGNPNPALGHAINEESGMRAGLTPETYHKLVLKAERRRRMNKEFDFVPELTEEEWDIYEEWVTNGGPEKMKDTIGKTEGREQVARAVQLARKHDKRHMAQVDKVPERTSQDHNVGVPPGYDRLDPDVDDDAPPQVVGEATTAEQKAEKKRREDIARKAAAATLEKQKKDKKDKKEDKDKEKQSDKKK